MVYEIFLETVTNALQAQLGGSYSIVMRKIPKNNGIMLDGICISREPDTIAPAIYLNSYYQQFLSGMSLEDILSDIEHLYMENRTCPAISMERFLSFPQISHLIAFKLIHAQSNSDLLRQVPHIPFIDLAIVFYLYLEQSEHGQMTALIYNEHLPLWELTTEDLFALARTNTPRLFPAAISCMRDVMKEIARSNLGQDYDEDLMDSILSKGENEDLYVLTNCCGINGAGCLLYEDVLNGFAEQIDSDLVILPSSIHEVILLADTDSLCYDDLKHMVTHINQTEVPAEDRLSDELYRYTRKGGRITPVFISPEPDTNASTLYS